MMSVRILLNSGRVSSQSIYHAINDSAYPGLVEHEPIKARFRPRTVLRNPAAAERIMRNDTAVARKIAQIDAIVAEGGSYLSVGWTNFSWADVFLDRWGEAVAFSALVRCPYTFAASLLTHGFFLGRDDMYQRKAIIQNDNPLQRDRRRA